MYVLVTGTSQVRWYFIGFYYFSVMIGINIIIGFAIDLYGAIERVDKKQQDALEDLYKLAFAEEEPK